MTKAPDDAVFFTSVRKLLMHRMNSLLEREVWASETSLDTIFQPFAHWQQVLPCLF